MGNQIKYLFFTIATLCSLMLGTVVPPVSAASLPIDINKSQPFISTNLQGAAPQLILTKTIDDDVTQAQVGDIIRYRIRWECSSLTVACGQMEITDVLQPGLEYLPPPNSSVPSDFTINYNGGARTITITKNDNNLLDGTQYDAVIAVRVDYDLRPLPNNVNNTVNGRIFPPGASGWSPATPASAPPITIGQVEPSWEITKTRVAPTIAPTIDTDVTYELSLCPVPVQLPSGGIAPLTNITLTDSLMEGAVFVSASDGGTHNNGLVSWNIAGPIYQPDCVTRYVTVRYPSLQFDIGDDLENTANVTATYTQSNGTPCPDCFNDSVTEPPVQLINIVDVPTYSKDDAGDPVGITGTARFILNLDTNSTNYPANEVVLIDNIPPELEVTSVTTGTWDANFDYVRAYIEYSTNNGSSWTAFPSQPVSFNSDAVYIAPSPNVTNVRWRFEHDQDNDGTYVAGLPYVWEFDSQPEIRVTPRAGVATIGSTYVNCVYVTRVGQNGPVTDNCAEEDITVEGDFASLRVNKNETPGEPWNEWDDPQILNFNSDSSILPGDTLRYVLTVELTERSSAPLINPTILDTLPDNLIFVRSGDVRLNGTLLSTAVPSASVSFTHSGPNPGAGQTLLWEINNLTIPELDLGSQILTIEFFARIPRGQAQGTRTNNLSVVTDSVDVICENGTQSTDGSDLDSDTNTTEATCQTTDTYIVERSAALRGEKWIRSVALVNNEVVHKDTFLPDASCPNGGNEGLAGSTNAFTRFPCIAQAYPEGALNPDQYAPPPASGAPDLDDFEYQLRIFNDGNVEMINYVLYDILPFYGDNGSGGTLYNSSRESEFRPVLTGPIEFLGGAGLAPSQFTIEYNLTTNPCRPEVFNQSSGIIPAGCNNDWLTSAAVTNWNEVRSFRIRLNDGAGIAPIQEGDPTNMVRFGVLMSIPADSPQVGVFNNDDAQSREISWNSFSHVGSYEEGNILRDLLASEPRKTGITIPERFSIGNRVWRDADNSGTINPPDDANPGIAGVLVHLYLSSDTTNPIATTTTDSGGYYLFSNLPAGDYVVGIPASNFAPGQPLHTLRSSTGTPASATYTTPQDTNPDSSDHGIDPATAGDEVFSPIITLSHQDEPINESDLSDNDRDGPAGTRRGLNGERDENSDLTVDFGFFGGTDIPFSIGNHIWFDNGLGANLNNGIFDVGELPATGVRVELYRDGNNNGRPDLEEYMRFDITDANGFYLFDNLDPGTYFVWVTPGNFQDSFDPDGAGPLPTGQGPLAGWYSSQPTFNDDVDQNDNGINNNFPEVGGINGGVWSNPVTLTRGVNTPTGETHLSGDTNMAAGFNPTAGDGDNSRGRFGEPDEQSNLTIDFGFIPPMSLGNRVWIDDGAGSPFREGYNNDIQDGTEVGVGGVRVELLANDGSLIRFTTTDANGYYLFDRLQPGDYYVRIPASNFASGSPLYNYISSYDRLPPADDDTDMNDNGIDFPNPATTGITSSLITMSYGTEPLTPNSETDISTNPLFGPNNRGNYGQADGDSNLTVDFGFVYPPRSIGNHLWFDTGAGANTNNGIFDTIDELPVVNAIVRLYRDDDNNGQPDDLGVLGDSSDDWIAWDITDANGYYLFDNLPPGRYIVGVDASNFASGQPLFGYTGSTGYVDNASNNLDGRDNGRDPLNPIVGYGVISTTINLTTLPLTGMPIGETGSGDTNMTLGFNPTSGDGNNSRGRYGETDANSDLTIDFGFVEAYSLGNRVWFDTDNDSQIGANEVGVDNVVVALYHANANGEPTTPVLADGLPRTSTTNAEGYYLFDNLPPGDYVVVILPSNFDNGGSLQGYWSSGTFIQSDGTTIELAAPDPDNDADRDDNGLLQTSGSLNGAVISQAITLGLNGLTEPIDETDLDSIGQGTQPNGRANMTVDFGFYRVEVGNLVFRDENKNGNFDGTDVPLANVQVRLYAADGTTEIPVGPDGILGTADDTPGGMLTNASGLYLFSGLPQGDYIVSVETPSGYSGTRDDYDTNDSSDPNTNTDNNDNGIGVGTTGEAFSELFSLIPGAVGASSNNTVNNANGTTANPTIDFGFVATTYSLGNRVWFDTNNDSQINIEEVGVNGVLVELYRANDLTTVIATDTTSNGGYYLFDNLPEGDYVVVIPASNFGAGGVLQGYWSSGTTLQANGTTSEAAAPDPDNNTDSDDNGELNASGAVVSLPITLGPGDIEPINESDLQTGVEQGSNPDERANMTVDFGFYRVELGNIVFIDTNNNGVYDAGTDTPLAGATVQLFANDGVTEINVGPDGILGTADDALGGVSTGLGGTYLFSGLPQGNYIVRVTPPVGYSSTIDTYDSVDTNSPDTNTDHNDNGVGEGIGQVSSNPVSLTPGSIGALSNNTVNNANGTTRNPTLDFGFVSNTGFTKTIISTNEAHTDVDLITGLHNVAIGEIITYRITIELPLGIPLDNVTITDKLDLGLAFVDCVSVVIKGIDETNNVCPPTVMPLVGTSANPAEDGREVVFTLPTPIEGTQPNQQIVIEYQAIVLDVIENQDGDRLNNSATWVWDGGSFTTSAPNINIVEPDLSIDKSATPTNNVPIGTPIQFTLVIDHNAPQSKADAFDVVVSDFLPANLAYVQCSVQYTAGLAPDTPAATYCNPGVATTDLIFEWAVFPLGQTSTITFSAIILGSPATNEASVAWTSLPIDPDIVTGLPIQLSAFNATSTERWYDPLDIVNVYGVSDRVIINRPANIGGINGGSGRASDRDDSQDLVLPFLIPVTGFAPDTVTVLPEQPKEKEYTDTNIWLEIPGLNVNIPITGVPIVDGQWDVSWLSQQAGWLEGTAFPGWQGNSALTSHVTLPNGQAGPFAKLGSLNWGDQIIVHAYGYAYLYEVRKNMTISPNNMIVLDHKDEAWLTLITCKDYNESTNTYSNRIAIQAVLIKVVQDKTSSLPANIR